MPERMATLEAKMESVLERLAHIDVCVDSLKRTVWQAAGAVAIIIGLINIMAK